MFPYFKGEMRAKQIKKDDSMQQSRPLEVAFAAITNSASTG